jgi:hypothetical protein
MTMTMTVPDPDAFGMNAAAPQLGVALQAEADAAKATALVKARYVMAWQRPRNIDDVRLRMLAACKRRSFAGAARFDLTRHNRGEGWTIRFAEEAFRLMGNLSIETVVTYEDDRIRKVRVEVTDLETNAPWGDEIIVEKTVERRSSKDREVISTRTNTSGDTVYIVRATDDEVTVKQLAVLSRRTRSLILRFIDGGILDECRQQIARTQRAEVDEDPTAALRRVLDGFASLNVMPSDLEAYLGKPPAKASPREVVELRGVWQAVKDGADFDELVREHRAAEDGEDAAKAATHADAIVAEVMARQAPSPSSA